MIGSDEAARDFIERVSRIAEDRAREDYAELLRSKRHDDPSAARSSTGRRDYYEERVKAERYDFDSQEVRPYFAFERVRHGILDVTARLFGIEYRRVEDPVAWAPGVETYDVYEDGERLGRLLPRHAPARGQVQARGAVQHPQRRSRAAAPRGGAGLQLPRRRARGPRRSWSTSDVETFFHEFGHLLHDLFAGRQRWMGIARHRNRVGLRRGALADARGVGLGRDVLQTLRAAPRDRRADSGGARRAMRAARASSARGCTSATRCSTRRSRCNCYDRRSGEPSTPTRLVRELQADYSCSATSTDTHFHAQLRPPGRLLGDLLHLHVVAGDRQGPVQPVRSRRSVGAGSGTPLSRLYSRRRRLGARSRTRPTLPRPALRVRSVRGLAREPRLGRGANRDRPPQPAIPPGRSRLRRWRGWPACRRTGCRDPRRVRAAGSRYSRGRYPVRRVRRARA